MGPASRAAAERGFLSALRVPRFRRLWIGAFLSSLGTWTQDVALNWLVHTRFLDPRYLGYRSFAADAPLRADALTVNPWLGVDSLEPFVRRAEAGRAGLFVLTRTSNPGGRDLQELEVGDHPVYQHVAALLQPLTKRLAGAQGWSGLGLVVGATRPEEAERVREVAPSALFLVPGYGAQGASARDSVRHARLRLPAPGHPEAAVSARSPAPRPRACG